MNNEFTAYEALTGRVLYGGTAYAPASMATESTLILVGEAFTDGWIDSGRHYSQPTKPTPHHTFNWQTKQWLDPRTLQDLKDAKWAVIKQARDAAEFSTFTYNDMVFDGDLDAQRRLASYISVSKSAIAAGQPFSADFTLADNSLVTLSAQDFVGIELAKVQAVAAAFSHGAMLRNQIELATVVAELTSIAW